MIYTLRFSVVFFVLSVIAPCLMHSIQHDFQVITMKNIEDAHTNVKIEMDQNQRYRYVFFGATALIAGGCVYTFFSGNADNHLLVKDTLFHNPDIQFSNQELAKIIIHNSEVLSHTLVCLDKQRELNERLGSWKSFLSQQSAYIVLSLIITGSLSPLGKYVKRIDNWFDTTLNKLFGTRNLAWFLQTHTQLDKLMDLVCKDASENNVESLVLSWNILMQELIKVLGFVKYRSVKVASQFPHARDHMVQCIIDIQHHVNQLVIELHDVVCNYVDLTCQFKNYVRIKLQDFALVESLHV